jgi:glycosyltransferase involved in cell wall biosynthesis
MNDATTWSVPRAPQDEKALIESWCGVDATPVVSVCCVTYNHERYIADCLEGILAQRTRFPFEVLLHDDASMDCTRDVILEYEQRFPSLLRPIYQTCNQYSQGRNVNPEFNFVRARGKYLAICEGDDVWLDVTKLQSQVDFLESNPGYSLCFTDAQPVDAQGNRLESLRGTRRDLSAEELQLTASIFTLTACFRNIFKEWPREFANTRYGDLVVWSLLGDHGAGKYLDCIEPSLYRQHEGGVHSSASLQRRRQMAIETMAGLFSYRLRQGQVALAHRHLEDILVHAAALIGADGFLKVARRAVKRLRN